MEATMRVLMMIGAVVNLVQSDMPPPGLLSSCSLMFCYFTFVLKPASSCYGYKNDGVLIAAASDAIWDKRAACGRTYNVRCTGATNQGVPQPCRGQSVVAKVVDYCPAGCQGTIDLSQEAFATIANPNAAKVRIEYVE